MQVTGIFCRKHYINLVHKPVASVSMRSPVEYSHPAFSQMAVQASCGRPLVKENCLIFHVAYPIAHFWTPPFKENCFTFQMLVSL